MADPFNPWNLFRGEGTGNLDMSWVKDYVNDVMKQAMPDSFNNDFRHAGVNSDVFETHHSMIARLKLPDDIRPENITVHFLPNELKIDGLREPHVIRLPVNGSFKGSKAVYQNGVLEIRVPKRTGERYQQIPIEY
ncbi:MAG TPA: Hsp20/alpha crystallin family protein [Bacillales bacterium]|nr:Hsp20/alpha crystallin family protein [Bacillales bacterium]